MRDREVMKSGDPENDRGDSGFLTRLEKLEIEWRKTGKRKMKPCVSICGEKISLIPSDEAIRVANASSTSLIIREGLGEKNSFGSLCTNGFLHPLPVYYPFRTKINVSLKKQGLFCHFFCWGCKSVSEQPSPLRTNPLHTYSEAENP